jgi:apolipoprotein N-acyltransferase
MAAQHHALDVMRAIEGDRWLARATNTGLSAIINPRGKTLWLSQMNQYQIHGDTIYRRQNLSLYIRWGDWFVVLLLALAAIAWVWQGRQIEKY